MAASDLMKQCANKYEEKRETDRRTETVTATDREKERERYRETDGQIERLRRRDRELTPSLPQPVKCLGWKMHGVTCKLYIFRSIFHLLSCFDENLFTCQCDKEKKKAQGFQILHFQWPFSSDIMAVKGLMKRGWSMNQTMRTVSLSAPYPFTSHAHTTLAHATNVVQQTPRSNKMTTRKEKKKKKRGWWRQTQILQGF